MLNYRSQSLDPIREDALQAFKSDLAENQPETFCQQVGTGKNFILDGTFGKAEQTKSRGLGSGLSAGCGTDVITRR
jgi:hypothetical protein